MSRSSVQNFMSVLNFYFTNEERIRHMAEIEGPNNTAESFIKALKRHAATWSYNGLTHTTFLKSLLVKHFNKEDKINVEKQTQNVEDR